MPRVPVRDDPDGVDRPAPTEARRPVTDRQLEILKNVARGRTNRQIGEALGISEKTVRNHLRTIAHKLDSSDRTHAVVLAIGNGWIPIPVEPDSAEVEQRAGAVAGGKRAK